MDNKNNTSLYEHTEEFPFPAMEPDKDEMFINIRSGYCGIALPSFL